MSLMILYGYKIGLLRMSSHMFVKRCNRTLIIELFLLNLQFHVYYDLPNSIQSTYGSKFIWNQRCTNKIQEVRIERCHEKWSSTDFFCNVVLGIVLISHANNALSLTNVVMLKTANRNKWFFPHVFSLFLYNNPFFKYFNPAIFNVHALFQHHLWFFNSH